MLAASITMVAQTGGIVFATPLILLPLFLGAMVYLQQALDYYNQEDEDPTKSIKLFVLVFVLMLAVWLTAAYAGLALPLYAQISGVALMGLMLLIPSISVDYGSDFIVNLFLRPKKFTLVFSLLILVVPIFLVSQVIALSTPMVLKGVGVTLAYLLMTWVYTRNNTSLSVSRKVALGVGLVGLQASFVAIDMMGFSADLYLNLSMLVSLSILLCCGADLWAWVPHHSIRLKWSTVLD